MNGVFQTDNGKLEDLTIVVLHVSDEYQSCNGKLVALASVLHENGVFRRYNGKLEALPMGRYQLTFF